MKKLMFVLLLIISMMVLSACTDKPTASDRFSKYIALWNEQKFSEMYDMLTPATKEKITQEEFVQRYADIYDGISAKNLKVTFEKPSEEEQKDKQDSVVYPFSLKMDTVAGEVAFEQDVELKKAEIDKEENWYITWSSSMIFPQLKDGEKVRVSSQPAVRGQIFDQNDKGLAVNGVAHEIGIVPQNIPENREETLAKVSTLLGLELTEIEAKLNQSWVKPDLFVPIKKIDPMNTKLLEQLMAIPSIQKQDVEARVYPVGEAAAHLTGYIGSITAEQLEELEDKGYSSQSMIGKAGLEQVYESRLKGEAGSKIYVNGTDKVIAEKSPVNGEDIKITVNSDLQTSLYEQLKGEPGTAVAIHPKTGETLALVSSPSYNPNEFIYGLSKEKYDSLEKNPLNPMMARFNKTFSPGSSLKPVTAAIGLESGTLSPDRTKVIKGLTWQKDSSWGNYYVTRVSSKVENVNLENALMFSDNIFFAQLALEIGPDKLSEGLKKFGFEEKIDYSFPTNKSTISTEGLNNEPLLADSGYGQGQIQMSPIHLAATYTPFLNEGNMIKPYLEVNPETNTTIWKEQVITPEHADLLLQDLVKVVQDPNGTAYDPHIPGQQLAGKTGTAELKQSKEDKEGKENGWFIGVNTNDPQLLIAMMIEDVKNKGGSHYVVPKVKQVFKEFISN
ncbi:penicillin-binding transpeptidase domain-containing protein [Metabacillus sediminilitoris]|uniref:serine-type D-Ala-D-Ala carboxypeptidase n=1 Tax=Metabacillus sediminilitoris TaxID=2567941 RepID=A0A4S4BT09_9BACI|nr:penicillin-binding transpeptidase domain-containing protein [Metabacillus sediminilitoris]QGQ46408.1 penicillin-binding transpeptidase domain-containing protein [Metabacillus sediminilitoris]THF77394.1 penicillin-binding transpeptidase domain-containing protein [Metabacillus sediminilitoris]